MPQALKTIPRWFESPRPDGDPIPIEWWEDARSAHELLALVGVLAGMLESRRTFGATRSEALEEARQWLEAAGLSLMPITAPEGSSERSSMRLFDDEGFPLFCGVFRQEFPDRWAQYATLPLARFREEVIVGLWEYENLVAVEAAMAMGCTHAVWKGGENCHADFETIPTSPWRDAFDRMTLSRREGQIALLKPPPARVTMLGGGKFPQRKEADRG